MAWIALCNYLALSLGLPLPVACGAERATAYGSESAAEAFPCRDHRCGCATAEQCWKSCCCFTHDEKLAWARRHGVTPPAYVVATQEVRRPSSRSPVRKSCCAPVAAPARTCCTTKTTCDDAAPSGVVKGVSETVARKEAPQPRWVTQIAAAGCRGGAIASWFNVPISLPAIMLGGASPIVPQVRPLLALAESEWTSALLVPAVPPPRIV